MINTKPYNLIALRQSKKLTKTCVAKAIGISKQHYTRLEAGTSKGSITVWEELSAFFGKPIDYLRSQDDQPA